MEFVVWEEKDEERGGVRSLDVMQWRALQALRGLSARHAMRIIYTGRALCNALHRQLGPWQLQSLKLKIEHVRQESHGAAGADEAAGCRGVKGDNRGAGQQVLEEVLARACCEWTRWISPGD